MTDRRRDEFGFAPSEHSSHHSLSPEGLVEEARKAPQTGEMLAAFDRYRDYLPTLPSPSAPPVRFATGGNQ